MFCFLLVEGFDLTMICMCVCVFVRVSAGDLPPAVAEKAKNRKHSPLLLWISQKLSLLQKNTGFVFIV